MEPILSTYILKPNSFILINSQTQPPYLLLYNYFALNYYYNAVPYTPSAPP